jgi:anaerobic selenocysteine-containing dehydrogenase
MMSKLDRRSFLKAAAGSAAAVVGGLQATAALALAPAERLSPDDPTAKALHYVEDVSKIDPAKAPTHKAGSDCANCVLYQAAAEKDGHAPCGAFAGKLVAAKGWCAAWAAKPAG